MKTGYRIKDVMTNMPVKVDKATSLKDAAQLMKKYNVNSVLVMENDELVGIAIDEDFVRKLIAEGKNPDDLSVGDIMETKLVTIKPDDDIYKAIVTMRDNSIRQLPVMIEGKLEGFLTLKDILKIQPELFDIMVESMEIREEDRKLAPKEEPI